MNEHEEILKAVGRLYLEKALGYEELSRRVRSLEEQLLRVTRERDEALRLAMEPRRERE